MSEQKIIQCPECESKIRVPKGKHIEFCCKNCNNKLRFDDRSLYTKIDESRSKKAISSALVYLLAVIVAFPIVVILNKFIPIDNDFSNIGKIILFIVVTAVLGVVFKKFQNFILISVGCMLLFLSIGSFKDNYGFSDIFFDYQTMMNSIIRSPEIEEIAMSNFRPFENSYKITKAVDYNHPIVRSFSHHAIEKTNFDYNKYHHYRTIIQSFAIFKEVKGRWNYVSDPENEDYFSKASETIANAGPKGTFKGDCDDYSIIIAAGIKSIGGKVRLIRTTDHLYPEISVGSKQDLEALDFIISKDLFKKESEKKSLYYHIDNQGEVWLNLDYTANYPGGKFLNPNIIGILNL